MLMKLRSPYLLDRIHLDPTYRSIHQGLVHHCQFFETGSTNLRDLTRYPIVSGNPVYGALSGGGVVWAPATGGGAAGRGYVLKFTASAAGRVTWSNVGDWNFGSGSFTAGCWVNPTTTTGSGGGFPAFVAKNAAGNGTAGTGWTLLINTGTTLNGHTVVVGAPSLYGTDGTTIFNCSSAHTINDGNWHFVVAGRDNAASVFWISVDGRPRETASATGFGSLTAGQNSLYGYRTDGSLNNNYYTGQLDDVRYWNRSLTDGEVAWLYNKQKLPSRANIIARAGMIGGAGGGGGGGAKQTAVSVN